MRRWLVGFLVVMLACSVAGTLMVGVWSWNRYVQQPPARPTDTRAGAAFTPTATLTWHDRAEPAPPEASTPAADQAGLPGSSRAATAIPPAQTPTPTGEPSTLDAIRATHPLPARDLFTLARRLGRLGGGAQRIVNPEPPAYAVGDRASFWISEEAGKTYQEITATLRYVGEHAAWWVQDGVSYGQDGLSAAAKRFDAQTYPTNRRFFGEEWLPGIDNDPRIHIVNGRLSSRTAGYFSSADEYPSAINPHSNQREAIYINIELDGYAPGNERYDAVIAHEFQHMIHWHNDANESTWVGEGLSELAVYLNGYGGEHWVSVFAREPDTQLNAWTDEIGAAGVHYGASYLFTHYFAERFGSERVRGLVASDEAGTLGFDAVLAEAGLTFDDLFRDWVVANYLDAPSVADGRYGYRDLDVAAQVRTALRAGESRGDVVRQYGTDYVELRAGPEPITLRFKGSATVPVLATEPHSGRHFLWSNRGDGSVTSMSRAFDLTATETATLEAWLWHDIEQYFDFAYVEVSVDGGSTWQILAGQHSVTENPTGNALGPGYSGRSQTDGKFGWVRESIDLTPYAGHQVLIRWEQLTDDGYDGPGLAIDDIAIPEIGYFEDFENGDGGWETGGFVRIDNVLPQHWALQVIEPGDAPRVRQVPVYAGRATFKVQGLAVLAISALTPFTTEPAEYTIAAD